MALVVEFHPEAVLEAQAARAWYAERSEQAGIAFVGALGLAVQALADAPLAWPEYLHATRRFLLRRFPFLVVYRVSGNLIQVIAVAHGRRRPGYWRERP